MPAKISEAADAGIDHPAFDGVPRTTGRAKGATGDAESLKLLMFMDGSSSLRDLAEVLSLDPATLIRVVLRLYRRGMIAFDDAYVQAWLVAEPEAAPAAEPVAPPPAEPVGPPAAEPVEAEPATDEGEKIRLVGPAAREADAGEPHIEAPAVEAEVEEPEEVAGTIVEEGRLEDTPAWQVLTRIARTDFMGWVRFSAADGRRETLVSSGRPVFCRSDVEEEAIASMLRQRDRMEEQDFQRYREAARSGEVEPSRLLVRLGILPEYNRLRALRWQAQTILFNTLAMDSGTFIVEKLDALPRRMPRFDLSFSRILTRFLDEKLPVDDEVQKLEEKMDFYLVPTEGAAEQTFQEKEQRLWEVIQERPRRLRDVLSVSTMFKRETYKFVLLLLVNGLVEMTKSVAYEEGPVDLRLLDDLAEDLEEQNYFDVLGVHAVSDTDDVEAGLRRMREKFEPSAYKSLDDSQRAALARCRKRVEEAHKALSDKRRRDEYRREVFSAYQLAQYAQLQYQKGEIYLWWRQSPREAFPFFRSAMELDPAQPIYWAAYAMSALGGGTSDPGVRKQAAQLADRVAGMSNADPVALVLAGGALMKMGQAGRGEECIMKATKLSPGNAAVTKMIKTVLGGGD